MQQENIESVGESLSCPVLIECSNSVEQDVVVPCPLRAKSPRVENSVLESLKASLKEEIISEIKCLLLESQRELLKLLKSKTGENVREEDKNILEDESRSFYTPTRSVRINSNQNNDPCTTRNIHQMRFENKTLRMCFEHFSCNVEFQMKKIVIIQFEFEKNFENGKFNFIWLENNGMLWISVSRKPKLVNTSEDG